MLKRRIRRIRMARPKRCRRICNYPDFWSFIPEGAKTSETLTFTLDEFEVIRLIDYQKMTQEECAALMCVSRATIANIYENARFKIADAMINGKCLRITGGSYRIDSIPASAEINEKGANIMRIAVTYENEMVGQHFGRTEHFKIYDIEDGAVKSSQVIDTNGTGHGALAGFLRAAEVEKLICGGIGPGARNALASVGIEILPGVMGFADEVLSDYLAGNLKYNPDVECHDHNHDHDHKHNHEEGHDCHHGNCGEHGCH